MIPLFSLDGWEWCYSCFPVTYVKLAEQIKPGLLEWCSAIASSCIFFLLIFWKYGFTTETIRNKRSVKQIKTGSHQPDSFSVSRLLQDTTEEIKGECLLKVNEGNSKPSLPRENKTFNCEKKVVTLKGWTWLHQLDIKLITFLTCNSMKNWQLRQSDNVQQPRTLSQSRGFCSSHLKQAFHSRTRRMLNDPKRTRWTDNLLYCGNAR